MSALFLAIPLTIFVLFVLPIWLWLHYSNRSSRGELRKASNSGWRSSLLRQTKCANVFRRWKPSWMRNTRTGGSVNGWTKSE
ncbi:phage shock protein B [Enterobacter hormaechei]|nr:phage shock protein B [Enterobacter hormaechei]